jgi:hypothetical protein
MEYARINGQITIEAGQLYKAYKHGNVRVLPETISLFYDCKKDYIGLAEQRYNQDYSFYDNASDMTKALLDGNYAAAQKAIDAIEADRIRLAGKKSPFAKYQH